MPFNQKENAINELNARVKIRIAPSKIHSVGVFAMRDIKDGEKLYAQSVPLPYKISPGNLGKLFPEVRELLLGEVPWISLGVAFPYPTCIFQAYINYAPLGECNYDCINDTAVRDISKGEEITENYKVIQGWEVAHPWLVDK